MRGGAPLEIRREAEPEPPQSELPRARSTQRDWGPGDETPPRESSGGYWEIQGTRGPPCGSMAEGPPPPRGGRLALGRGDS